MSWPDQIWPKSHCRQMQTYATDCKKIKFSYCLDEEAWAEIHLFRNWLHWDGLAICPTCEMFSSHILGALILASGVGQSKCKCLMFTNRNWFRDSWSVLLPRSLPPFPSLQALWKKSEASREYNGCTSTLFQGRLPGQFPSLSNLLLWLWRQSTTPSISEAGQWPFLFSRTENKVFTWAHLQRVELAVLSGGEKGALEMKSSRSDRGLYYFGQ